MTEGLKLNSKWTKFIKESGLLFILFFTLTCCKTAQNTHITAHKQDLPEQERMQAEHLFFNANKEKILGNYEQAADLFAQCIQIDKENDAAMYELAQIMQQKGKLNDALFFIRSAAAINPSNEWYQLSLAHILQKNKLYAEAVSVNAELVKNHPDRIDYYFNWANALLLDNKLAEAIKVYDKLEERVGVTAEVSIQKQNIYFKTGKIDKAISEMQKLINAFPEEPTYYEMLAELYLTNNMSEKAFEVYQMILQLNPQNPSVHLSLADYYRSTGDTAKSFEELQLAFSNKELDIDTKIKILSSYYILIQKYPVLKEQAITLNKILIATHPNEARSHAVYGDFLYQDKKYEDAKNQYLEALKINKENFLVWQQLLFVISALNDYNSLLMESEEALTLFPDQPIVYLLNGIAKTQLKKYEEAVSILNSGINLVVENPPLLVQFYANLGDVYHNLNKIHESDTAYEKALSIDPKNTYVLNNYSYYLSLRGDSLEKAEDMSKLSNELEPDNSSFQDTYAWILYKSGKYKDAKMWLEKALKNGGDTNSTILEHYGDVCYKLGDADKALEYWERAGKAGTASEWLNKKIADKKLYE